MTTFTRTRTRGDAPRRLNAQRFDDGVVASYIHEISDHQRPLVTANRRDATELRRGSHPRRDRIAIAPLVEQLEPYSDEIDAMRHG